MAADTDFPADLESLEFIDNGGGITVQADVVHDVVLLGSIAIFTSCYVKRTPAGVWYKEPAFYARFPKEAVPPGIVLTARKLGIGGIVPAIGSVMRQLVRMH
jgi:hypothetical protein